MRKLCIMFIVFAMVGSAMAIVVPDASFERLAPSGSWAYVNNVLSPWDCSASGGGSSWIGDNYIEGVAYGYPQVGHNGTAYVDINGDYIYQTLSATYIEGETYRLSIWATTRQDYEDQQVSIYFRADANETDIAESGALDIPVSSGGTHDWYQYKLDYTADANDAGKNITIRFLGDGNTYIDDIKLEIPAPTAWNPDPGNWETGVPLDKTLSWNTGLDPATGLLYTGITSHVLYMGVGSDDPNSNDPNLYQVGEPIPASGDTGHYTPGGEWLERDGTYLWRIDEVEAKDDPEPDIIYTGDIWTFKTVTSFPIIDTATPATTMVDLDDTAIFTVSAINPFTLDDTGMTYQWYKVGTPDTAVGTDSTTLTINNVQPADEGWYYCTVTITSNSKTTDSRTAGLGIKKLLGHWKLDDAAGTTAADSSVNSNTGTVKGDVSPAWTTGIDGGALSFDGVDYGVVGSFLTDYVDCGEPNSLKPTMQVTVSGWYNTDTYSYYGQIAGFAYDTGSDESGYAILTEEGGYIGFWLATGRDGSGTYLWTSDVPAAPTGWTHIAGTYDGTTMRLYINGYEKASTGKSGNINYDYFNRFMIGLHEAGAWWLPYQGDIDDVKVYNYAIDPLAVAKEYTAFSGETVCLEPLPLDITGPDGEPDCIINLWDFQGMAASWLECHLYPVENCPSGGV